MALEGLPVEVCTRVLGVSESGYYDWKTRAPSVRSVRHALLTDTIRAVHHQSRGIYGARRVHAELTLGRGLLVAHHREATHAPSRPARNHRSTEVAAGRTGGESRRDRQPQWIEGRHGVFGKSRQQLRKDRHSGTMAHRPRHRAGGGRSGHRRSLAHLRSEPALPSGWRRPPLMPGRSRTGTLRLWATCSPGRSDVGQACDQNQQPATAPRVDVRISHTWIRCCWASGSLRRAISPV